MSTAAIVLTVWCAVSMAAVGLSLYFLFQKAGQKGWYALVPLYNSYITDRVTVSRAPMTGAILGIFCGLLSLLMPGWLASQFTDKGRLILSLIPFGACMLVTSAIVCANMAEVFGKPDLFGVGMFFLPFVFWPLLAFDKSAYVTEQPAGDIGEDFKALGADIREGGKMVGQGLTGQEYAGTGSFQRAGNRLGMALHNIPFWFRSFGRGFTTDGYAQLDFLKLSPGCKRFYKLGRAIRSIPFHLWNLIRKIGNFFKKIGVGIGHFFVDLVHTFITGDWKTKVSYVIMGFGSCARGQWLRGILFFVFQTVFNIYLFTFGWWHVKMLPTLGTIQRVTENGQIVVAGHNSFFILLYGVLTLFFIVAFLYTWYQNIKQNRISEEILRSGHTLKSARDDMAALADEQFHKTLLALPSLGVFVFTILPIFFMILIAFTNFDHAHQPPSSLFTWVGTDNFGELTSLKGTTSGPSMGGTFRQVLLWTLIWAVFATFLNYFLGMLVAIMINKKGIRLKKVWRTILVMTIAIPQFVSLLYVSKMFAADGLINTTLQNWGWISGPLPFWTDKHWARVAIILINVWIGIPYLMLIATGILMNIPADLYESARIDGANGFQMYRKITLPYMLFVTGPYLLTSFTGNINNFNVIFLLSGGEPSSATELAGNAGGTDLLITWLYKMTVNNHDYNQAAVIGILVFVVTAVINLIVYNMIPSVKNEEDFQ